MINCKPAALSAAYFLLVVVVVVVVLGGCNLPMSRVENEPLMGGLDNTMMAMMLPMRPKMDTPVRKTPSTRNSNIPSSWSPGS